MLDKGQSRKRYCGISRAQFDLNTVSRPEGSTPLAFLLSVRAYFSIE